MAKKKRSNNETFRVIKINRSAVREILFEFFMENQENLFQLANTKFTQPLIEMHFLEDGGIACCIYDWEKGIPNIPDDFWEDAPYTAKSAYASTKMYRPYRLVDGAMQEDVQPEPDK